MGKMLSSLAGPPPSMQQQPMQPQMAQPQFGMPQGVPGGQYSGNVWSQQVAPQSNVNSSQTMNAFQQPPR